MMIQFQELISLQDHMNLSTMFNKHKVNETMGDDYHYRFELASIKESEEMLPKSANMTIHFLPIKP